MTHSFEEQIRERAYHLWRSGGMAEGLAHEHWLHAERALMSEQAPTETPRSATRPASPRKAKVAKTIGTLTPSSKAKATVAALVKKTPSARVSNTIN